VPQIVSSCDRPRFATRLNKNYRISTIDRVLSHPVEIAIHMDSSNGGNVSSNDLIVSKIRHALLG